MGTGVLAFVAATPGASQAGGDTADIVTARRPTEDREVEIAATETVPRRWYNQVERARRVNRRLKDRLLSVEGVRSVGITTRSERVGQYRRPAIRVRHAGRSVPADIPDHANGIPIQVDQNAPEVNFSTHGTCSQFSNYVSDYDPVKGGAVIEGRSGAFADDDDCTNIGTACCRVWDLSTGNYYLMTAHHLIDGCGAGDVSGQSVYQHGDFVGPVAESHKQHDVVFVGLGVFSSRSGFSDQIVQTNQAVSGYVDADGVASMASRGETVKKRGIATGAVTATVSDYETDLNKCLNTYQNQIEYTNTSNNGGDSGGPYFTDSGNGYNLLVGMHSANIGILQTSGVAAYQMDREYSAIPT